MGSVLDSAELTKRVQTVLIATYGDIDVSQAEAMPLLMVGLADKDGWGDGKLAFINTEGVGEIADDYNLVDVWYYTSNWGQLNTIKVGRKLLVGMATDEKQDLAEWVRVFGSRLDSNVRIWQNKMPDPTKQLA
jgi:hypothetical protein